MHKDRLIGASVLVASVFGIFLYGWLIFTFPIIVLQLTAFIAVAAMLGILAWIGWTMATTPPPEPIDAIEPSTSSSNQTEAQEEAS